MDFYQVLEKRRTIRNFSDREVPDEVLGRILAAAFKAPTNDHLRQLEFVVVRGQENISRMISPVAENTENIQQAGLEAAAGVMDRDEHAMFTDALPKQQKMLMQSGCLVLPFFRQKDCPLCEPADQSSLNYFASAWAAVENILLAATAEGLSPSVMNRNTSNDWSTLPKDTNSPAFLPLAMQPQTPISAGRKRFVRRRGSTKTFGNHGKNDMVKAARLDMPVTPANEKLSIFLQKNRADRKHEPKNSYICTQENIRKQKMIATTTYHDTYGGSLRSMTMDMMYMRNRFRRV